jgi:hypothetical protein
MIPIVSSVRFEASGTSSLLLSLTIRQHQFNTENVWRCSRMWIEKKQYFRTTHAPPTSSIGPQLTCHSSSKKLKWPDRRLFHVLAVDGNDHRHGATGGEWRPERIPDLEVRVGLCFYVALDGVFRDFRRVIFVLEKREIGGDDLDFKTGAGGAEGHAGGGFVKRRSRRGWESSKTEVM